MNTWRVCCHKTGGAKRSAIFNTVDAVDENLASDWSDCDRTDSGVPIEIPRTPETLLGQRTSPNCPHAPQPSNCAQPPDQLQFLGLPLMRLYAT